MRTQGAVVRSRPVQAMRANMWLALEMPGCRLFRAAPRAAAGKARAGRTAGAVRRSFPGPAWAAARPCLAVIRRLSHDYLTVRYVIYHRDIEFPVPSP